MMHNGIFIRNFEKIIDNPGLLKEKPDVFVIGDYSCPYILPSVNQLEIVNNLVKEQNKSLYYISPKINQSLLEEEHKRVIFALDNHIHVSINDWGLLYYLRDLLKAEHNIYLGRLLTKSILSWIWSDLFLEKEELKVQSYLGQNNFHHQIKMEYFYNWQIKGIEVDILEGVEDSLKKIIENGYKIIGFSNWQIAAVSRSCPFLRIEHNTKLKGNCSSLCKSPVEITKISGNKDNTYPSFYILGNTVFSKKWINSNQNIYSLIVN